MGCWQVWWNSINQERRFCTISDLYKIYLRDPINSNTMVPDSFSLELLTHWCICTASHKCLSGFTSAVDVMEEFIIYVQTSSFPEGQINALKFGFELMPISLNNFLQKFTVPYLVQSDSFTNSFSDYVRIGQSNRRLYNSNIWDVNFDLFEEEIPCKGYIKCGADAVGMPELFSYYKKACINGCKIAFIVAKKYLVSLRNDDNAAENLTKIQEIEESKCHPESQEPEQKKSKTGAKKIDYAVKFQNLWENPINHFNWYSVVYDESSSKFKFVVMKEFENPVGVFVLIETNFDAPNL